MRNRKLYQETFSQVEGNAQVRWEDCEKRAKGKKPPKGRLFLLAAVVVLLGTLSATAAVNFLGLRDTLLPAKGSVPVIDPETGVLVSGQTQDMDIISLSGYMDTPESQALVEWQSFLDSYDEDKSILYGVGNDLDPELFAKYGCYSVYTQEMGDKLEEIAAKYGLKLHTDMIDLYAHPEALGTLADFGKDQETYWTYMYEDGTCHFDGSVYLPGPGSVDVQFQRTVRGTLNEVTLNIRSIDEYEEWSYVTACGQEVLLALGSGKAVALADLEDSFASFNVLIGTDGGMTRERLEAVVDCYDFTLLSPVEVPTVEEEPDLTTLPQAAAARQAYRSALWELLDNGVFPDGTLAESTGDSEDNAFSICDVDGDGEEELIIIYKNAAVAGQAAYVLAYDDPYSPPRVELLQFPNLTILDNGMILAGASHNQGLAGDALWPYTLYQYDSATDSYEAVAYVDAWEKKNHPTDYEGNPYPDEVDVSGVGVVYYVCPVGATGATDPMDAADYNQWLTDALGPEGTYSVPQMRWYALTRENILALGGH